VSTDYLKLTSYFGERLRSGNRFVADALLDLYGGASVATSVMLRGIASFGPRHQLRSDETLSMSEDPPAAVAAVDTADKIAALAEQAVALTSHGLITLERAQLLSRSTPTGTAPPHAAKLTIYVGRRQQVSGRPAHHAVCDALHCHGFTGATVFLGVDGTAHGQRRRAHFFSRNHDVPVMVIGLGTDEQVARVVPELEALMHQPLLTVERVQICKREGRLLTKPTALPATDANGLPLWQKLTIHTSEADLHDGAPIHRAIVRRLLESDTASGATVLRGVWGFQGDGKPHGDKLFQLGRRVPVTTIVIDTPDRIAASFEIVDRLTDRHGLVSSELVPALVSIDRGARHGGTHLARHTW
jgi:PII-like signaling protein